MKDHTHTMFVYWVAIIAPFLVAILSVWLVANSFVVKEGYTKIDDCPSFTIYGKEAYMKAKESYDAGNKKLDRGGVRGIPCESFLKNSYLKRYEN